MQLPFEPPFLESLLDIERVAQAVGDLRSLPLKPLATGVRDLFPGRTLRADLIGCVARESLTPLSA